LFKEAYPDRDFSDFWLEASLKFSICSFDRSTFFLLREDDSPAAAASSSSKVVKTKPFSPRTDRHVFAYASDVVENNSRDPGTLSSFYSNFSCNMYEILCVIKAIKTFFVDREKMSPFPTLPFCTQNFIDV
jgi:hypothetical protein